ncbi:MAG: nitroreductase family protein [Desulfurispora sp.]|uniref:nitroreductase family protein n=1 Tax=Desulfurispora sp. TaxID=3014275 RepID=UPI004049D1A1
MDLLTALKDRRSVRAYLEQPVTEETIRQLLEYATYAPSGSNLQPWRFAVVQDQQLLQKWSDEAKAFLLTKVAERPYLQQYKAVLENQGFHIFYHAPALLLLWADSRKSMTYINDCSMAAQNIMLAAHSLGLGSCWIGFFVEFGNKPEFKQALDVPDYYKLIAPLALGYPRGSWPMPPRQPAEILFWKK